MAEIGSGGGTGYPSTLDTDTTQEVNSPTVGKTKARAEVINDLSSAVVAIQKELGTDPAGSLTDVVTFLQTEHNANGTHGALTPTALTLEGTVWPSFSVHRNGSDQADITGNDKVEWTTEIFDTNSDFAANRFTPTVAGKYLLTASIEWFQITAGDQLALQLWKGGTEFKRVWTRPQGTTEGQTLAVVVDADGSADYFEIYASNGNRDTSDISGNKVRSYFMGCRIG